MPPVALGGMRGRRPALVAALPASALPSAAGRPDRPIRWPPRRLGPRPAGGSRLCRLGVLACQIGLLALLLVVVSAGPAWAQAPPTEALSEVIGRLRTVIVVLLVGLATLFLTVGGLRYYFAGSDPGEVEKAKATLKYAAVGYGVAALAPMLVTLLRYVVGA